MSQQINLFNPAFVPRWDWASAESALVGLGLVVVVAVAGGVAAHWHRSKLLAQDKVLTARLSTLKAEVDALSNQVSARKVDPLLEKQLADGQTLLASRRQVMHWLDTQGLSNTLAVSEYFRALARQTLDGIWLTGFHVTGDGKDFSIEGRALHGDLVPEYLRKLSNEQMLRGRSFATVVLEQPAPSDKSQALEYLAFKLASTDSKAAGYGDKP